MLYLGVTDYNFKFLSLKVVFVFANSEDPDEMPYNAVFTVCQRTYLDVNNI